LLKNNPKTAYRFPKTISADFPTIHQDYQGATKEYPVEVSSSRKQLGFPGIF